MSELEWFDGYTGQSVDELIALEGQYRIDSLVASLEQALQEKAVRGGPDRLSQEEGIVLAVEALEREVNNGGYDQFFLNTPAYVSIIVDALRRIGCPKTADITQRAVQSLAVSGPLTAEAVEHVLQEGYDDRAETLSECDNLYYASGEDIAVGLFEFVKRNRLNIALNR